jgi:hypothetical protein
MLVELTKSTMHPVENDPIQKHEQYICGGEVSMCEYLPHINSSFGDLPASVPVYCTGHSVLAVARLV